MKRKILGTGLSGMIGSRIIEQLQAKYNFEDISLEQKIDITDRKRVLEKIRESQGDIVLHLAAKTDVDGCEKDKILGEDGQAWKVNVLGTRNVVDGCLSTGKKIIYISTDFVFDGVNPPTGGYTEDDLPNPISWYGRTKYEGEKIVKENGNNWLILRLAFPYRSKFPQKKDFARAVLSLLEEGKRVRAVIDQFITPTFIDDFVLAIDRLINDWNCGIYHCVGSQTLTPYAAAKIIAQTFIQDVNLIEKVSASSYYKDRAPRPFKPAMKNDKITKLGIKMRTFQEGQEVVREQLNELITLDNKEVVV